MKVTMLLADAAQEVGGKLYILGGGWSQTGPNPSPFAIAIKLEIPWDRANHQYKLQLDLLGADGEPVEVPIGDDGKLEPIKLEMNFEAGRPSGLMPGTPLDGALAINFSPLPLEPGKRYQWRLTVDGRDDEDWTLGFNTRPKSIYPGAPPAQTP
jgi:hypothetical protein